MQAPVGAQAKPPELVKPWPVRDFDQVLVGADALAPAGEQGGPQPAGNPHRDEMARYPHEDGNAILLPHVRG